MSGPFAGTRVGRCFVPAFGSDDVVAFISVHVARCADRGAQPHAGDVSFDDRLGDDGRSIGEVGHERAFQLLRHRGGEPRSADHHVREPIAIEVACREARGAELRPGFRPPQNVESDEAAVGRVTADSVRAPHHERDDSRVGSGRTVVGIANQDVAQVQSLQMGHVAEQLQQALERSWRLGQQRFDERQAEMRRDT